MLRLAAIVLLLAAAPAGAATRNFSVVSFTKLEVSGPYQVDVRTGSGQSATATGSQRALDQLTVEVRGDRLVIQPNRANWGGWSWDNKDGPVVIVLTVPSLASAVLSGSGTVTIDRLRGESFAGGVKGAGKLVVAQSAAARLTLSVNGAGVLRIAGRCAQATVNLNGSGTVDAAALRCDDAQVNAEGSGTIGLTADRSAKLAAVGSGDITVTGSASCLVNATGSGAVRCGKAAK